MVAYLVIREGSKWTDVFRLIPGQAATIGRAPTNQIVVKDERCSRAHAEVFHSAGNWILRDLESRNGTAVGGIMVHGDYVLNPGDVVRIGQSQLAFVHDLAKAFPDSSAVLRNMTIRSPAGSSIAVSAEETTSVLGENEPTTITHRRGQTRFSSRPTTKWRRFRRSAGPPRSFAGWHSNWPNRPISIRFAGWHWRGVFEATQIDAGAVLLLPRVAAEQPAEPGGGELEIIASRSDSEFPYHRVSNFLASTVLREGEAVLGRNIMDDSTLGSRDSKGEIHATSVICAPIRKGPRVTGLIHLYSTNPDRIPDPDDLEFTLAVADTVAVALENLARRQELAENLSQIRDENLQLRERLGVESEIIGNSPAMASVHRELSRAAPSRATVLIRGESGVGKELVARAIHFASPRRKGPFVCLNCAALTESLLESELFGHERGAFTGATERKIGKFEAADTGTLMLDEIGEMSPTIQAKFLRVLEGHPFERVGGATAIKVDVRVIAATNRDLERAVSEGQFRRDLYFRLHVLEITVPALRKRPEDIPILAHYFLQRFNAETGRRIRGFTPAATDQITAYRWPGNVRELKNVVERAVVLTRGEVIDIEDLMLTKLSTAGDTADVAPMASSFEPISLDEVERRHILATLQATGWNKSQTANILGIERSTLDRKIRRYELDGQFPLRGH